jgi:hypothetical protein
MDTTDKMDKWAEEKGSRMYRLGVVLAVSLFLNALVGLLNLMRGTPAYAISPQPVYLTDASGVRVRTHRPATWPKDTVVIDVSTGNR